MKARRGADRKLRRLKVLVRRYRRRCYGNVRAGYPEEIRDLAIDLMSQGSFRLDEIREGTGLSFGTLQGWQSGAGRRGRRMESRARKKLRRERFSPVAVLEEVPESAAAEPTPERSRRYNVSGPGGLMLPEMSMSELAELWRELERKHT